MWKISASKKERKEKSVIVKNNSKVRIYDILIFSLNYSKYAATFTIKLLVNKKYLSA